MFWIGTAKTGTPAAVYPNADILPRTFAQDGDGAFDLLVRRRTDFPIVGGLSAQVALEHQQGGVLSRAVVVVFARRQPRADALLIGVDGGGYGRLHDELLLAQARLAHDGFHRRHVEGLAV